MRVVLAADAIKPPLTGIGRYTWELATRLPNHAGIKSVHYLAHGRWRTPEEINAVGLRYDTGGVGKGCKIKNLYRCLGRNRVVSGVYDILAALLTKASLNRKDIDIFHGPNYFVPEVDVPCVVTVHDLSTHINQDWHPAPRAARINRLMSRSVANSKLVITDSQAIRTEVISYFDLPEDRVVAIPLGVDVAFRPRAEADLRTPLRKLGLQPGGYCLCVSTIEPRKNILRLINSYRKLPAYVRRCQPLVLVGEPGWNSQGIHESIMQACQEGWLKYMGFVSQDLLPLLYAGCRLFVYPSLYEGFGLPIAEAMASGVPVLTSNRSSMPEVADGAAWLVEPENENDLRDGLLAAIEDEFWRSKAVKEGLRRVSEMSWEVCIAKTVEAYRAALNK
ncbi:Glycogen synthase [Sporotomaculum syntrophicum]|uniref:Glycogen synthase n=1 Tax=Sporotomaculum syntrophicum TaxID=182264 RepID=A0A9D2WR54_9FIRM|nr:glycosyltransferase family 1 protein [Sporotomaculum syntrophicum]KAF1086055.1 Glycogen synthase [Sporotomaculum syntrophicum]